jgi:hypothetical protein
VTYLRFFHASINCPKIDFYINKILIEKNYDYKQMSEYFSGHSGIYNLEIKSSNDNKVLLNKEINLKENYIYTAAVTGLLKNIDIKLIQDNINKINSDNKNSEIRFINLSPSLNSAEINLNGNDIAKINFNNQSDYFRIKPEKHSLSLKEKEAILKNKNINLDGGKTYSSYVLGVNNLTNSLDIVTHLEGKTFLA